MDENLRSILSGAREFIQNSGIRQLNTSNLAAHLRLPESELRAWFPSETSLIEKVLEYERNSFKTIFDENNFEETNAIEILMIVSKAMSTRFLELTPSVTSDLESLYPEVYYQHIEQRIDFIFMKMKINIDKGIRQGIYREDLSIELLARLYISRLIDLHNAAFFPPEKFSFKVLYEVMIDNFIRGIANDEGLIHYKKLRKSYKMC
ncbi:MAG: hypothetical protein RBS07_04175 [Lentimicrobium sp.]|jgi:hypothetical protein|nr:hypothetical protein [Lentimicrobium sp.]